MKQMFVKCIRKGVATVNGPGKTFAGEILLPQRALMAAKESAESVENITGTVCAGHLIESKLKQLLTILPILYVKAVEVDPLWSPESVGYIRSDPNVYECPVYTTSARGPTFVFLGTMATVDPTTKWILAGVAILLQSDD